ncbi:MAG: hypothetical protein FWF45_01570 [Coriobacteriia bacterium]|nr:hypothetical protein [Coriobacteriia bacterium]
MKYSFTIETDKDEVIDGAIRRMKTRRELADALGAPTRALREYASDILQEVAHRDADLLVDLSSEIIDALDRPESFTRYNILVVLDCFVPHHGPVVAKALYQLDDCLYDEESKIVRQEAFEVLCHFGATTETRSKTVWEYLSGALRCYHGDPEYMTMLNYLCDMLNNGKVADSVKEGVVRLFIFDAEQGKGMLQKRAQQIVALAPEMLEKVKAEQVEAAKRAAAAARAAEEDAKAADDDYEELD